MARLTKQQLRVMEQRDKRNTRQAGRGLLALILILAGALWGMLWWLCVTLPILSFRFVRWLIRNLSWRGWLALGILLAAAVVIGYVTGGQW